ncbi:hypothetical protein Mgra_00005337 [Meloidogyne graminicola]|uniref:CortBP2/NAV1-like AAA+ ATPase lid domain-containing protein n=1 Tax=Meloidogyne graminicola TaxID=189291 RepID=A0A8S9ZPU8_9BILA|nr:hypothetical protein Mgra_00005337 [Meloidogyne graminicola]
MFIATLPCISSSSSNSSPNEEEVSINKPSFLLQKQQQIQHYRLALNAVSNDSTTSQDSLDSVRTAIHRPNQQNNSSELQNSVSEQMSQKMGQQNELINNNNSKIFDLKKQNKNQKIIDKQKVSTILMPKCDQFKNYQKDCINFYSASSCSSLSSALSEPLDDDDEISTSDLTTASSSIDQNSPEKNLNNMEFIGFRASHPSQKQQQQQFIQPPKIRTIQNKGNSMVNGGNGIQINKLIKQRTQQQQQLQQINNNNNNNRYSVATERPSTSCNLNDININQQQYFSSSDGGNIILRNGGIQQRSNNQQKINNQQQQQQQSSELFNNNNISSSNFRAYHTFNPSNFQQKNNQQHRILSPSHNLMALSDDGDTLSVAAGEIGDSSSSIRHPAYHTHSLDRHAHLRILQQPRIIPNQNNNNNNCFYSTKQNKLINSKQLNNNQFGSLLISSSRIYSNIQNNINGGHSKYSSSTNNNSCLNSPNRIQLISSDEIIQQQQPGSQLSLISSLGSGYSTIEERYEWEVNKLQNELESYRTTVSLLNQRHSGYNCMLQIFDTKLQTIMSSLSKLQQKRHVKRNEVERLCREIEHLRALSISAGVIPSSKEQKQIINNNEKIKLNNDKLSSDVKEQSNNEGNGGGGEKGGGKKTGWKSNVVIDNQYNSSMYIHSCVELVIVYLFILLNCLIRSSFTRAFQKGSSKKNKQQTMTEVEQKQLNEDGEKINQQPVYVNSLKKELENKELALTDVQLDALDKAKEIDILRETVNQLKHENRMLKYNFSLLERRVRSESRASSHISLNTNLCSGCPQERDLDIDALEEAANQLLQVPEQSTSIPLYDIWRFFFKYNYNRHISSNNSKINNQHSSSSSSFIKVVLCVDISGRLDSNNNNSFISTLLPPSSSCSLASISRASSGSSSTLSSLGSALSNCSNNNKRRELSIGYLPLPFSKIINWKDLDQQLGLLLEEYLHLIDPDMSLGIDSYSSIIGYQIIPKNSLGIPCECLIRRKNSLDEYLNNDNNQKIDSNEFTPNLPPEEVLLPGTLIRLKLKGVTQNSVDSLILESLFPKNFLEELLDQLEKYRRLIIFGTAGIGKSNLARLLSKYYLMKFNIELNSKSLIEIHFPSTENNNNNLLLIDNNNETKIQQAKEQLLNVLTLNKTTTKTFVLLDNLPLKHLIGVVYEVFQFVEIKNKTNNKLQYLPFIICTLNRTNLSEQLIIQKLQNDHNFHLCPLNQKMEAVNGYLGRYIRRRMAEQTLGSISNISPNSSFQLNSLDSLIDFLNRSLYLINEFIERTANGGSNVTLGPRILLQCPLEGEQAKEWFIRLWNDKLIPYLRKAALEANNPKSNLINLTEQIKAIWPWKNLSDELKQIN